MKEAAEPQGTLAPMVRAPARAAVAPAAGAVGLVLQLQRTHGNAHVARLLAQQRAGVLGRMPIRRGAGHGSVAETDSAHVYEQPNESRASSSARSRRAGRSTSRRTRARFTASFSTARRAT